ncbi:accessory factor UbiK family protein [Candidatus Regiella insecticola]|nr:accessory factor UbiK family protein [Candidatus Regiella insecticola]
MFGLKIVEMITKKVQGSLPETANRFKDNIEKKVGNALQAQLPRLNLINREEFDVQSKILSDTSEKLALLERKLEALEAKLGSDTPEAQSSSDIEKTIP